MTNQALVGIFLVAAFALPTSAAPKVATATLDVTTFAPPAGWKRAERPHSDEYTVTNDKAGAAASIMIMRSISGATDARANFDKAWANFITEVLPDAPAPTMAPASTRGGWKIVRGTTAYTYEGRAAKSTLLAATHSGTLVIVLGTTIGTAYQKDVDTFFTTLRFAAPATPSATTTQAPSTQQGPTELSGSWGFSTGGAMGSGQYAPWLSDRREYAFDGRGNYTFLRRHNVDVEPETSLIRERGTYTLAGDVLALKPAKSEREVWKKVRSGANAGAYEKLLRREKVTLENATYRVSYTFYLDTQVPNLMLAPAAATQRDGNFNATTQYRLFRPDGKYYTAVPPTP